MGTMLHDRALLDALEEAQVESFEGIVWRITAGNRHPLAGSSGGGRWSPPSSSPTLYTSLQKDGAVAEIRFRLSMEPVFPAKITFSAHQIQINLSNLLDISGMAQLALLGVDLNSYNKIDYARTHLIAAAARFLEYEGMLVPNARYQCKNLVIFLDRLRPGSTMTSELSEPIDQAELT